MRIIATPEVRVFIPIKRDSADPGSDKGPQQAKMQKRVLDFIGEHPGDVEEFRVDPFGESFYLRPRDWSPEAKQCAFDHDSYGTAFFLRGHLYHAGGIEREWLEFLVGIAKEQGAPVRVEKLNEVFYYEASDAS